MQKEVNMIAQVTNVIWQAFWKNCRKLLDDVGIALRQIQRLQNDSFSERGNWIGTCNGSIFIESIL